jgi:alkylation response protein AidB-like acyl-CoA dehydrogenase
MGTQIGIGSSSAELLAAWRLIYGSAREAMAVLEAGGRISMEQRHRTRLSSAFAGQLMLAAVQRVFQAAGGRALFTENAMQRALRDVLGVTAHRALAWDSSTANYGNHLLGHTQ